jgi:ribonuclease BN (tRNA processing enzyme)
MKIVFVTHIHGDHQLGLLRLLAERDKVTEEGDKIYLVIPPPLLHWVNLFIDETLTYKHNVVIVNSSDLNPESVMYYQHHFTKLKELDGKPLSNSCERLDFDESERKISDFQPSS